MATRCRGDQQHLSGVVGGRAARPILTRRYGGHLAGVDLGRRPAFPRHPERVPGREGQQPSPELFGWRHVPAGEQPVQHAVTTGLDSRTRLVSVRQCLDVPAVLPGDAGEGELCCRDVVGGTVPREPGHRLRGELGRIGQLPLGDPNVGRRVSDLRTQQVLAEPVGGLRGLFQRLFGIAELAEPAVRLADSVQRLGRSASVFGLAPDC